MTAPQPAETQTYRVHIGGGRCTSGQECVELDHSVVGVAVPVETQQDDERARIAEEVASRYFERGDDELGQLRTDVYAALTGDFAQPSADTETLRDDGAALIAAERRRQVTEEGWSPEHDAEHHRDDLAIAAACYATPARLRDIRGGYPYMWVWARRFWKPTPDDRVRELVKAGALIAAEIDRLRGPR